MHSAHLYGLLLHLRSFASAVAVWKSLSATGNRQSPWIILVAYNCSFFLQTRDDLIANPCKPLNLIFPRSPVDSYLHFFPNVFHMWNASPNLCKNTTSFNTYKLALKSQTILLTTKIIISSDSQPLRPWKLKLIK